MMFSQTLYASIVQNATLLLYNVASDVILETLNKRIWNMTTNYFIYICTKYYSEICCLTDSTTNFSFQDTNTNSITYEK